jgi:hypothetical protein
LPLLKFIPVPTWRDLVDILFFIKLRDALRLLPGLKVRMVAFEDRIEMIPVRKISEIEGFLNGIV